MSPEHHCAQWAKWTGALWEVPQGARCPIRSLNYPSTFPTADFYVTPQGRLSYFVAQVSNQALPCSSSDEHFLIPRSPCPPVPGIIHSVSFSLIFSHLPDLSTSVSAFKARFLPSLPRFLYLLGVGWVEFMEKLKGFVVLFFGFFCIYIFFFWTKIEVREAFPSKPSSQGLQFTIFLILLLLFFIVVVKMSGVTLKSVFLLDNGITF